MADLVRLGARSGVPAAMGLVLAFVWVSISGGDVVEIDIAGRVPTVAFGGGAGEVTMDIRVSEPASIFAAFSQYDESSDREQAEYAEERLAAGQHARSVDIGKDTYFSFEIEMDDPPVGAVIEWTVYLDGEEIWAETERLDEPLEDGYGFFVQLEAESIADLRAWLP